MKKIVFALLLLVGISLQAQEISIIPKPAKMDVQNGKFLFNGKVVICYPVAKDVDFRKVVDNFVVELKETTGVKLAKSTPKKQKSAFGDAVKYGKKGDAHIVIHIDGEMAEEEYKLSVTTKRIDITTYQHTEKLCGNIRRLLIASCRTAKENVR